MEDPVRHHTNCIKYGLTVSSGNSAARKASILPSCAPTAHSSPAIIPARSTRSVLWYRVRRPATAGPSGTSTRAARRHPSTISARKSDPACRHKQALQRETSRSPRDRLSPVSQKGRRGFLCLRGGIAWIRPSRASGRRLASSPPRPRPLANP